MAAAEATGAGAGGATQSSLVAGLAILGIGLAGLTGAFVVTVGRRRAGARRNR